MKIFTIKIFVFLLFLFYSLIGYAQSKTIDSLNKALQTEKEDTNKVNTTLALCRAMRQNADYANAMKIAKAALFLAKKLNFKHGEIRAYNNIAINYQYLGDDNKSALENFSNALKIQLEFGNKAFIGNSYIMIAHTYYNLDNYPEGLRNAFLGLKFMEESGDKQSIIQAYDEIGFLYYNENNIVETRNYYSLEMKLARKVKDTSSIVDPLDKIGETYFKEGNYDEAMKNYMEALNLMKDTVTTFGKGLHSAVFLGIGDVYKSMGTIASSQGDKEKAREDFYKALDYYFSAVKFNKETHYKGGIVFDYTPIGEVYIKLGKLVEAKEYVTKAIETARETGSKDNLTESYRGLFELDSAMKNYKQAFEDHKMYILYRDSLNNSGTAQQSLAYNMQYEADKKEALAKEEQFKKDAEARRIRSRQQLLMISLAILVFAGLIIAFIQFRNNKQKQKANLLLDRQKQKVEITLAELKSTQSQLIQSEKMASLGELTAGIAHEIQNPLNFVNNFSEVSNELIEELQEEKNKAQGIRDEQLENKILGDIKQNLEKISHHGKRADAIVKGMLQHSRTSNAGKEPTDINRLADEYLKLAYHGLRAKDKSFNASLKTNYDLNIGKVNIIAQDIGRVMLNLINNAFYAVDEKKKQDIGGYEPTVSVHTRRLTNQVELVVKDNGNGIPKKILDKIFQPFFTTKPTGQGTGLGLSLAYDIVKTHGGEIKVNATEGEGSEFLIQLPV